MGDLQDQPSDEIITSFLPRMFWLRYIRGYKLENKRRIPNENAFGEIYYKTHWVLSKDSKDE